MGNLSQTATNDNKVANIFWPTVDNTGGLRGCRGVWRAKDKLVVEGAGPSLLGRDWLEEIRLSFAVQHMSPGITLGDLLSKHEPLFRSELGEARNITAAFHLKQQVTPRFCNARTVPYALREKIEVELERLQKEGIIEPVLFSELAAPIVPVIKQDGTVIICGDYKLTVNKV